MRKAFFCAAAALLLLTTTAGAVTIYAPNGLARPTNGPDDLIMFDSANPAGYTVVGSMNVPNIGFGGMDFDRNGNLWAYASFYKSTGGAATGLYHVDLATGQATQQGSAGLQSLQDLAFNPTNNTMYGVNTQGTVTKLYTVNLTSGGTSLVGTFTGLPDVQHSMGLAIDATGNFYVQDLETDRIYKGAGLALTQLYQLPQDTNFSQGMTIDWSRDNQGYHAAVGYGTFPHYFSQLNYFTTDGSSYTLGSDFGPELPDGLPPVECGDVAIMPVPEPGSLLLLTIAVLFRRR